MTETLDMKPGVDAPLELPLTAGVSQYEQALGELESEVRKLENALAEFANLHSEKETLEHALA